MSAAIASVLMLLLICVSAAYGLWCVHLGMVGRSLRHFVAGALLWVAAGFGYWLLLAHFDG